MTCEHVPLPGGGSAIVCSSQRRQRCKCGRSAMLLCDWKVPSKSATCDAPICGLCSTSPEPGKDLCPTHAEAFKEWSARRATARRPDEASAA
jgi:hypothetical protein